MVSKSTQRQDLETQAAAVLEMRRRKSLLKTVVGIVSPSKGLLYNLVNAGDGWKKTKTTASVYIAEKLESVLKSTKRFIIVIGGRGSTKSVGVGDICIIDAKDNGGKTYCLREFQSSIKNSVQSLLDEEVKRLEFSGFEIQGQTILHNDNNVFEFAGLSRNVDSIKSAHGFKRFWVEESQFISEKSLNALTPTARNKPNKGLPLAKTDDIDEFKGVSMIFVANPGSSNDPFSKRFIEPFKKYIDRDGYYEDELHLVVKINYQDNPWFVESGLESERLWDMENMSTAYYDHRWGGDYNDSIDNSIIKPEWFDAAIDAHKIERLKKVFTPHGAVIAAHDPSDEGEDAKGFAIRHGSIIKMVQAKDTGEIDEGCDWATGLAIKNNANWFVWDGDGMGTGLKRQVSTAFNGTGVKYHMFRGSLSGSGQDNADKVYMPQYGDENTKPKTFAETFKNNRAQYYTRLAVRFYNTFRCVVKGEYVSPDEMISIDSKGVDNIHGLRSEMCRIPAKDNPNGLIQIMNKQEMKKLEIASPNEADAIMMSMFIPPAGPVVLEPLNYKPMSII